MQIFSDGDTVYITWDDRPDEFVVATKNHTVRIAGSPPSAGAEWRPVAEVAEQIAQAIEQARENSRGPGVWSGLGRAARIAREHAGVEPDPVRDMAARMRYDAGTQG